MLKMPRAALERPYPNSIPKHKDPAFISAILIMGIYLCFYNVPIFCQHENLMSDANIANDAEAEKDNGEKWFIIKSTSFTIYCKHAVNLSTIERRLGRRGLFISGVYGPNPVTAPPQKVAYRMDMLLKRVKAVLDMYPSNMNLKIKIFDARNDLNEEYFRLYGSRPDYKSFYVHDDETIYTSEQDMSDSVIAHEMGHAVIDHYFSVRPPKKISEVLASYVDKHLED